MAERERSRSRLSSTSSHGREVRCACQFYQSDSLLPERQALLNSSRPSSRAAMVQTPPVNKRPVVKCRDHDYESIGTPAQLLPVRIAMKAPVVRITDADLVPVLDSDDSIDEPGRFRAAITLDGDLILPLDGHLEDTVMEGKELRHDGDTPDEEGADDNEKEDETPEQFQKRLEKQYFETFKTVEELHNKQTESEVQPEVQPVPNQGSRSLQKLKSQAGKLRSRLKSIQRPTFKFTSHKKSKPTSKPTTPTKKETPIKEENNEQQSEEQPEEKKTSKIERFKMALPERSKFKLHFPDRSKFHIKKPNIHMPSGFTRKNTNPEQTQQRSTESTYGSRKNIFDFLTLPRIFDRKSKANVNSSKESQSQDSQETATFPRARKSSTTRWTEKFEEAKLKEEESVPSAVERSRPWRHPSVEEPRLSFSYATRRSASIEETSEHNEDDGKKTAAEDIRYMDYEDENSEMKEFERSKENIDPRLYGDQTVHEDSEEPKMNYRFSAIDSRTFDDREASVPRSEGSFRSDREQQSSGSSSEKRRHGVIEEIDSDEFFLRERGISQEDMIIGRYLANEIRDALRSPISNALEDVDDIRPVAPQRPKRSKSMSSRKDVANSFKNGSSIKHHIVYWAETDSREKSPEEPLDDIVVVKPERRKSKSSLQNQNFVENESLPPTVPRRRKKSWLKERKEQSEIVDESNWPRIRNIQPSTSEPAIKKKFEEEMLVNGHNVKPCIEPKPTVPKRRSRSRGTSLARDEDRTSHGAESIPEYGFEQDDIPKDDESSGALPGYSIIEKRDRTPTIKPSPPRRLRRKFSTTPRSFPKRTQRTYDQVPRPTTPFEAIATEHIHHSDHEQYDEILNKIQGRPLPAPPRPPRSRREQSAEPPTEPVSMTEVYASTQTDPLPDDVVIEEEITQAKLIMAPSRSGSQIMISTERIPSPACRRTPPIPPLPNSQRVPEKRPTPERKVEDVNGKSNREARIGDSRLLEMALMSNEPLRINTLEVGDLRVDRLNVSQLEAYKIAASEIDAIVVSATEMSKKGTSEDEPNLHSSLLRELLAIKSHLETVSGTIQNEGRPPSRQRTEDACTATSDERIDKIPATFGEEDVARKQIREIRENQSPHHEVLQVTDKPREKPVRQSASPVRSLPPVISVTPDTTLKGTPLAQQQPQRALLSNTEDSEATPLSFAIGESRNLPQQFVVVPSSQIPLSFLSLEDRASLEEQPGVVDTLGQLIEVLRLTGLRAARQFVTFMESRISHETSEEKIREVEVAICALLLVIAGLILVYVCSPHTVTHHHHWDFLNPPQG